MSNRVQEIFKRFSSRRRRRSRDSPSDEAEKGDAYSSSIGALVVSGEFVPLARELDDLLGNSSAMTCFMNFMEHTDKLPLLRFWLRVQGFKSSTNSDDLKSDAISIFEKYIADGCPYNLDLPDSIRLRILENLDTSPGSSIKPDIFDDAQSEVWKRLKNRHFKEFLDSPFYAIHRVDVYRCASLELLDILRDHQLLRLFGEFMDAEQRRNLLDFIISVEGYDEQESQSREPSTLPEHAIRIYNQYVSMQAVNPLNFDASIRVEVEANICTESGIPHSKPFERAKEAAYAILDSRFLPLFLKSQPFLDYTDKLAIDTQWQLESIVSARSQCSSARSSIQNGGSLYTNSLTDTTSGFVNEKRSLSSNIDDDRISVCSSGTAFSTDIAKYTGSLARIDLLGRYEPLFDISLCLNTNDSPATRRNGLITAINRYVKPTTQEDEQSYETARRIVEDIRRSIERKHSIQSAPQ